MLRVNPYTSLTTHRLSRDEIVSTMPLWGLPSRPSAARDALLARGFTESRKDHFKLGCLWAGIQNGKVYVGFKSTYSGEVVLRQELGPHLLKKRPASEGDRARAIAQTHRLTGGERRLDVTLKALGFKDRGGGLFEHKDGSWIFARDGKLTRGVDNAQLSSAPKPLARGEFPTYDTLPSPTWDWFKRNTALGHTPRISSDQAPRVLKRLGYAAPKKGENVWRHKDGSWFRVASYTLTPGFQKWRLAQLPFNNRKAV